MRPLLKQVGALAAMLFAGASFVSLLTALLAKKYCTPHLHTDLLHNFGVLGA